MILRSEPLKSAFPPDAPRSGHYRVSCVVYVSQSATESPGDGCRHFNPVPIRRRFGEQFRPHLKAARGFHCHCDLCSQVQIYGGPLRHIDFALRQQIQSLAEIQKPLAGSALLPKHRFYCPSNIVAVERELVANILKPNLAAEQVTAVRKSKKRIGVLSYQPSLDDRSKDSGEDRSHRSDRGPSIPVHRACIAKPPALAHAIKHRHSVPLSLLELILP